MSLIYPNRYPDRYDPQSTSYPQGKFRNRSTPEAHDGGYFEQDLMNDWAGFFGALLKNGGVTPNGVVDTALNSQYYDALMRVARGTVLNEWGDRKDATLSQDFLSKENLKLIQSYKDGDELILNDVNANKDNINTLREGKKNAYVFTGYYEGQRYSIIKNIHKSELKLDFIESKSTPLTMHRVTAKQFQKEKNYSVICNAMAFKNADGTTGWQNEEVIPDGIFICNNTAYYGWDNIMNARRNQALAIMNNGDMDRFYSSTSVDDMVSQGVKYAVSWGAFCLYDGQKPSDFSTTTFTGPGISARTVLLFNYDDTYSILAVEGVTNVSGLTGNQVSDLTKRLGAKHAYILDGGGSTQSLFGSVYTTPSSDVVNFVTATRRIGGFFCADVPLGNEYSSGIVPLGVVGDPISVTPGLPPLYVIQTGNSVETYFNFQGFINGAINADSGVPVRFRTTKTSSNRVVVVGGGVGMGVITSGAGAGNGGYSSYVLNNTTPNYTASKISYHLDFE